MKTGSKQPLLLVLAQLSTITTVAGSQRSSYPPYCSRKEDQIKRRIPALREDTPLYQSFNNPPSLIHVTTVIRHGSRTPYAPHTCWAGYTDPSSDTSTWQCTLSSLMRPQSESAIALEALLNSNSGSGSGDNIDDINNQSTSESGQGLFFEFQKLYDANWSPKHPSHFPPNMSNELRGNCQKGQLILAGHAQQIRNGELIRQAYIKKIDDLGFDEPDVGVLYDFNEERLGVNTYVNKRAYDEPRLYFRSDDDERTLMSGSFVVQQVFDELMKSHESTYKSEGKEVDRPVIRLHTADRSRDVLAPNHVTCPRLTELARDAMLSREYKEEFELSEEAVIMNKLAKEQFGGESYMQDAGEAFDCVMTTLCEDKTLPYVLDKDKSGDDQEMIDKYGKDILDRYIDFNVRKAAYILQYRSNLYSQIATNPLWNDILAGLLVFTVADEKVLNKAWPDLRKESKLALYSAHDTTLMTLLASLGGNVYKSVEGSLWPPYASMLNIELFDINLDDSVSDDIKVNFPTGVGFRLVFNGQVMTEHVTGCMKGEEICDIDVLVLHTFPFSNVTEWGEKCERQNKVLEDDDLIYGNTDDRSPHGTDNGPRGTNLTGSTVVLIVFGCLFCAVCGSFTTYLFMVSPPGMKFRRLNHIPQNRNDSLEMTTSVNHMNSNNNENGEQARIYGLPVQQGRDII